MAVYVNTNVSSLNGRRYLNNVQNQLSTTYQRLSSGMRSEEHTSELQSLRESSYAVFCLKKKNASSS